MKSIIRHGLPKFPTCVLLACLASFFVSCSNFRTENVSLIVDAGDKVANENPSQWALGQLQEALSEQGVKSIIYTKLEDAPSNSRCVVVAGSTNKLGLALLEKQSLTIPETPEALGLVEGEVEGRQVLLACGYDSRGLVYALLELADRMNYGASPLEALKVPEPVIEKPALKIRSIYRTFTSEVEDKSWYNDREFWTNYLTELATQRVNRFSLALGMGYNSPTRCEESYFFFAYPFLVDVPGYDVHAGNLSDEERDSNFEMLKFISEEAAKRGLEFQLALWSHGINFPENTNYPISGLTEENHATYCRDALSIILKSCPSITGVTYRVHKESGIPEGTQDFWEIIFEAHNKAGRPVWIDMHGKNLTQEQLTWALETGMPVSASPKYVGEHMGLGYHPADVRRREKGNISQYLEPSSGVSLKSRSYTRSGYGDFLPEDREWDVLHRIWPGTNVLLLSGDPAMAASYGRATGIFGSLGVERIDPLGFKGRKGSGFPGGRCAYADKSLEPRWDFQKFLYTYRVWGRMVYNPDSDPEVWMRFLRSKFGDAAESMGVALAHSSRVVHLMTTAHGAATDCTRYWPEMYTNQPIVKESEEPFFDDNPAPKVFGNVSPHDPQLFADVNEFADALLEAVELPKYSPLLVARWLEELSDTATFHLNAAESLVEDRKDVEFRRFYHDIRIQCGIAKFFASKIRAAVLWHLYESSGDTEALAEAIRHYTTARDVWVEMAEDAKSIYVENVSFGNWATQSGHWIDRIPAIDTDIADMKEELAIAREKGNKAINTETIKQAIQIVETPAHRARAECRHEPADLFKPGEPMGIELSVEGDHADEVFLYYRHANQAIDWQMTGMKRNDGIFQAVIPGQYTQTRFPMEYYFTIDMGSEGTAIYPGLDENLANTPYYVVRQKK